MKRKLVHRHNFGDYLSFSLVKKLSQAPVQLAHQDEPGKLQGIGSILWSLQDGDVIWGSGAHRPDQVPGRTNVRCVAVRGPLTLQELRKSKVVSESCSPLFFDPGVLISVLYPQLKMIRPTRGRTLLIPHYTDMEEVRRQSSADSSIVVANPFTHPKEIARQIAQSERVLSSSLHGIILSEALGIPVVPVRLDSNREPFFKYQDYYQGTGREAPCFARTFAEAMDKEPIRYVYSDADLARFLNSFPYPLRDGAR